MKTINIDHVPRLIDTDSLHKAALHRDEVQMLPYTAFKVSRVLV